MGPTPQSMLPPQAVASMVRNGSDPNSLFQQNPLSQNMTPNAMGADPTLMQQPPAGSQAMNPTMPPPSAGPQAGMAQPNMSGPDGQPQPMDESTMLIKILGERLDHHSTITEKTLGAIVKQLEANQAMQNPQMAQ